MATERFPVKKLLSCLVCVAVMATSASCSWFQKEETTVKTDLIDCAKQDLGQSVSASGVSLLMTVVAIIATGGADWTADLAALESKYSTDAVSCAEKIASDLFKPSTGSGSGSSAPATGAASQELLEYQRAQQVLAGKKFK